MRSRFFFALAMVLASTGCVIRYGGEADGFIERTERQSIDFTVLEGELLNLRETASTTDVDRRDRLDAALQLLRVARRLDPEAQVEIAAYLQRMIAIEKRWESGPGLEIVPASGWSSPMDGGLGEVDLGGAAIIQPIDETSLSSEETSGGTEAAESGDSLSLPPAEAESAARDALARSDYAAAISILEACLDPGMIDDRLWREAEDGFVGQEWERAGALFLAARDFPDVGEQVEAYEEVLDILTELVERYPRSSQAEQVRQNVQLVARERAAAVETLEAADGISP